ncbi:MAG: hypothetical protein WDA02_07895 [Saccharofermentanales bacterium]|jgi:hypothetical protein
MKIKFKHLGKNIEITYNEDNGYLDYVKDLDTDEYLTIESKFQGKGIDIKKESFMIGSISNVCDARYARLIELDIFIPRFIYIKNY